MPFAERLKELRENAGLTQAQLAERLGIHREAIARMESGKHEPLWGTVQALGGALGVSCEAFTDAPPRRVNKKRG